ncbi:transmembrane protein 14 homolog [Chironomus tepperi]|uniref:transmembrane protein 14 homolog n=1 Tax=Chironomus tepperi TaxID=113505 RepID=UPI00391F4EB3
MTFDWTKMDFIGFAYSALVASGGIFGYIKAQSIPSLAAGLSFGAVLGVGAYLNSFSEPPRPTLQFVTASALGGLMGYRFYNSGKIMPAGVVFLFSLGVIVRDLLVYRQHLPLLGK